MVHFGFSALFTVVSMNLSQSISSSSFAALSYASLQPWSLPTMAFEIEFILFFAAVFKLRESRVILAAVFSPLQVFPGA